MPRVCVCVNNVILSVSVCCQVFVSVANCYSVHVIGFRCPLHMMYCLPVNIFFEMQPLQRFWLLMERHAIISVLLLLHKAKYVRP